MAILIGALLGWGLWLLLIDPAQERSPGGTEGQGDHADGTSEDGADAADSPFHRGPHRSGTLVLRVRTPDGAVPRDAEVGYSYAGRTRWRPVDERGRQCFTDAPLGRYKVRARAPEYEEADRACLLQAGIPEEIILVLHPAKDPSGG